MEKIKSFLISEKGKDFLTILIIIFVGLSSFGLGRLSKENPENGLKIESQGLKGSPLSSLSPNKANLSPELVNTQNSIKTASGNYFASIRGKKYYPTDCSAGNNIKQENKIYFMTAAEAEKAGYELSSSCQ